MRLRYLLCIGIYSTIQCATPLWQHDTRIRQAINETILNFITQYSRPITTLDFNSYDSYYSCGIAKNIKSTCVMLAPDEQGKLMNACTVRSDLSSLVLLKNKIELSELCRLSECEHFDFVFAVHGMGHLENDWEQTIEHLFNCGDHCMILLPLAPTSRIPQELACSMCVYVESKNAHLIKTIELDNNEYWGIYFHSHQKPFGGRVHWNRQDLLQPGKYVVHSSFTEKRLYKPFTKEWTLWQRGINLRTFIALKGAFPTKEMALEKLREFKHCKHNDLTPCNIIVQGKKIIAIDFGDPRRRLKQRVGFKRLMNVFEKKA